MGSDPAVRQFEGTVIEQLPSATYVVELPNRERVKAHMAAATKLNATRLRVKDKVLVGNSGGEFGVRGWVTVLSTENGQIAWKAYNTGPDTEVLIGANFKPFYAQDQGQDLGVST